jgi:hypothetical protein
MIIDAFSVLKNIVSPSGSASLKVPAENGVNIPQPDKLVTIKKEGSAPIAVRTSVEGIAVFPNADPGRYEGTVDMGNGVVVPFVKEIDTGVNARVTVVTP